MKIVKVIGASIGVIVCFFYLGCGSVQVAEAAHNNVSPLAITTKALPSALVGTPYVAILDGSGGTPGYTWKVNSGALPSGLTLATATGVVSGTPNVGGNYSFSVSLSDAGHPTQNKSTAMTISVTGTPLSIPATALAPAAIGAAYSQALQVAGGVPAYKWSVTAGSLPAGLALASTGAISGVPTASGTFTFTASVQDGGQPTQTASIPLSIVVASSRLQIKSVSLPAGVTGAAYSQALQATGGTPAYRWTISSGSLPAGLILSSTGSLSGTPAASGTAIFTATVSDNSVPTQTASATVTIVVAPTPLSITASTMPSVVVGTAYSQTLRAAGGTQPYKWSIASGSLPSGLVLASATGTISGVPTQSGSSTFTAAVTDSSSPAQSASATASIVVSATALKVVPTTLPAVRVGTAYSQTLQATGGTAPYKWAVTSGSLPAGLALSTTGAITGTPTASGVANFIATVTDSSSPTQNAATNGSVSVSPILLTITSSSLPSVPTGSSYTQQLHANGGATPYTWSITSGKLPAGLTLMPSTGTITGVPTTIGTATFTASVVDSGSPSQLASATTAVVVAPAATGPAQPVSPLNALAIATSALPSVGVGTAYSQTLQASGGTAPYTWALASGQLPAGLSISTAGLISGTPTATGTATFSVSVTDSSSPAQTQSAGLTIATGAGALSITSATLSSGSTGTGYAQTLAATGGTPAYTWQITSGSLPAGLTLAATTGVISGTPTTNGTSTFTAVVQDNGSPAQTQSATTSITIAAAQTSSGPGATWYVNAAGGSRYSVNSTTGLCDGTSAAAPVGTTPNQHCAFNDVRYLWTDGSYNTDTGAGAPKWGWIGHGGDTYLIDCSGMTGGACRVGQNGPNPGDGFGLAGNPSGSGAPVPLSGSPTAHTQIFGINHGACSAQSARTQIYGGYGTGTVLSMNGASYVDIACLDITDHSSCGRQGQLNTCNSNYPVGDFATDGIGWSNTSTNDTLTDVRIHGMSRTGMIGPTGTGVVMTDIAIIGNASSGWNADNASGTTGTGTLLVQNFNISWNGCAEEYPIVDALPYSDCTDDNAGGYGDGFGTATTASVPGWQAHFDQGVVSYNTQDGLDALHLTGSGSSMTITRVLAYGNMGQQIKVGGASGTAVNNLLVTNCNALRNVIPGTPAGYNSRLSDFCRAADTGIEMTVGKGSTLTFDNNTVYAANGTAMEIDCDGSAGPCDSTSLIDFRNNIFLGFINGPSSGYPGMTTGDYSNPIYAATVNPFPNPGSIFANNLTYHPKSSWGCPATYYFEVNAICADPHLVDETWHLYGYGNMSPAPGSVLKGAGALIQGITSDYTGAVRTTTPTIGAYE